MLASDLFIFSLLALTCGLCLPGLVWTATIWRQQKQLQIRMLELCTQMDVFAEASVGVGQCVEAMLVSTPNTADSAIQVKTARLAVAKRRILTDSAQSQADLQQAFDLSSDEIRIIRFVASLSSAQGDSAPLSSAGESSAGESSERASPEKRTPAKPTAAPTVTMVEPNQALQAARAKVKASLESVA